MLVMFLMKRAAVLTAIFAIAALFIDKLGAAASFGAIIGAVTAIFRIRILGTFIDRIFKSDNPVKKSMLFQVFSLTMLFVLLTAAVLADVRLFFGMVAGILTVPLVISFNAFTEKLGVTRNHWGIDGEAVDWKG